MLETPNSPAVTWGRRRSPAATPTPAWNARLRGMVTALEARHAGSAGHSGRVAAQSGRVARGLGLSETEVRRFGCAARVHDAGKVIVSPEILEKPGRLCPTEFAEIKRHAAFGGRLVASLGDPELAAIVRHHHERIDGSGYPDGLRGDEIPLGALVVAVADTYDALTSPRPYRDAFSPTAAIAVLEEEAGRTLAEEVVGAFVARQDAFVPIL